MSQHANMMVTEDVRLVRQLGQGGMGTLWVGYDTRLDREVAVKFITPDVLEKNPGLKERFAREAQSAARIRSPYVVQIHAHGEQTDGSPYMVMELLEGESLGEFLESGRRLTYQQCSEVLGQVGKALTGAHKLGVVHRDIKPDNIFLLKEEDLFVKLLDFGIAKHSQLPESASNLTATGSVLGTPHFMSPEQLLNTKGVDHRADLWALGVVGYILVTGELPFVGDTLAATIVAITSHAYTPPSTKGAPPAFDEWFARVFHRVIDQRFADAKSMTDAFATACRRQTAAPPITPPTAAMTRAEAPFMGNHTPPPPTLKQTYQTPAPTRASHPPGVAQTIPSRPPPPMDPRMSAATPAAAMTMAQPPHGAVTPPPGIPQTFAGSASTLSGEKSGGASKVVGLLVAFAVLGGAAAGGFLYLQKRDKKASAAEPTTKKTAQPAAKPKTSSKPGNKTPPPPDGMVAVPSGKYSIGCDPKSHKPCLKGEQPLHEVDLEAFAIGEHEVTMEAYDVCVASGKCPNAGSQEQCNWQQDGREKHPINCVTLDAAKAFCASKGWRLPTEQEWEAAARPKESAHRFPWGSSVASCDNVVMKCGKSGTKPVGSQANDKSQFGAFDLGGNVREWTSSSYVAYPGGNVKGSGAVNRGGSYLMSGPQLSSVYTRSVDEHTESRPGIGFRCAVNLK